MQDFIHLRETDGLVTSIHLHKNATNSEHHGAFRLLLAFLKLNELHKIMFCTIYLNQSIAIINVLSITLLDRISWTLLINVN